MGKRQKVRAMAGDGVTVQAARTTRIKDSAGAAEAVERAGPADGDLDVQEHLSRDLARVRAKFSMDAPPGKQSLSRAWMSEVAVEEYEAEFVDTVADCLGAGISLQDALTCWDSGDLAAAAAADEPDAGAAEDEAAAAVLPVTPRRPTGGHRLFVR